MQTLSGGAPRERADGTWFVVSLAELGFRIGDNGTTSGAFLAVCAPAALSVGCLHWPGGLLGSHLTGVVELRPNSPRTIQPRVGQH